MTMYDFKIFELEQFTKETLLQHLQANESQVSNANLAHTFVTQYINANTTQANADKILDKFIKFIQRAREATTLGEPIQEFYTRNVLQEACLRGYNQFIPFLLTLLSLVDDQTSFADAIKIYSQQEDPKIQPSPKLNNILNQASNTDVGDSPIHYSVFAKDMSTVTLLLDSGADINQQNNEGDTALHRTTAAKNKEMISLLIQRDARQDIRSNLGLLPIEIALINNHNDCLDLFKASHNQTGLNQRTPLHFAISINNYQGAAYLLKQGCSTDAKNTSGDMPLHTACKNQNVRSGFVSLLLQHNAPVDAENNQGETPLHCCLKTPDNQARQTKITSLLAAAAPLDAADHNGQTPRELMGMTQAEDSYAVSP